MLGLAVDVRPFRALAAKNAVLKPLAEQISGVRPPSFPSIFEAIVNAVACQQVSLDAGIALLNRFTEAYGVAFQDTASSMHAFPRQQDVLDAPEGDLKQLGFSYQKARAIKEVVYAAASDGAMFAADELVFGSLRGQAYVERDGLVIVPGTGIAVCLYFWHNGQVVIKPGEGAHMLYDADTSANGCGCQSYCFESQASGVAYERKGVNPADLSEAEDVANMAPPLGRLVANIVKLQPQIDVVVVPGTIANKRRSLTPAIEAATTDELHGYVPTPEFVRGSADVGGTRGCLAYWLLANN